MCIKKKYKVRVLIEKYFKYKNLSLANLKLEENLDKIIYENNKVKKDIQNEIYFRNSRILDFRYNRLFYDINIISIEILDNKIIARVLESTNIRFECSKSIISSEEDIPYEFIIVETINGLRIFNVYKNKTEIDFLYDNSYRMVDLKEKKFKVDKSYISNECLIRRSNVLNSYREYEYKRLEVVKYAEKFVYKYNPKYKNYDLYGGDCTNFASQCLKAGGVPFDNEGEFKWYWYSDNDRDPSWTSAKYLRRYLLNNNGGYNNYGVKATQCSFSEVKLGDIVQFEKPTHSMVVTGCLYDENISGDIWKNKYEILITQHSSDDSGRMKNFPLSLKPDYKGRFYININNIYK